MNRVRAAFIAVAATALVTACNDGTTPLTAPGAIANSTSGMWTSTVWQPTANGLQYVGTRTGTYRSAVDGKAIIDSGVPVQLDAAAIATAATKVETELVINRLKEDNGLATARANGGNSQRRPQLRNARTVSLGTLGGKTYALQQTVNATDPNLPPMASILTVDGRPVGIRDSRYRKTNGRWHAAHNTTTVLDSASHTALIVDTDYGTDAVRALGALDQVRSTLTSIGDAVGAFIQPTALHAEAVEDVSIPCLAEMETQLKAAAAWTTAAGLLAGAIATCPMNGLTCAAIPFLTATLYIADAALGIAIGNYAACMYNYNHPRSASPPNGGGGGSAAGQHCFVIDWYESRDGGKTWNYVESTMQCGIEYME